MKTTKQPKQMMIIFLSSAFVAIIFNPTAFKRWTDELKIGVTKNVGSQLSQSIINFSNVVNISKPSNNFRNIFFDFRKNYVFNFSKIAKENRVIVQVAMPINPPVVCPTQEVRAEKISNSSSVVILKENHDTSRFPASLSEQERPVSGSKNILAIGDSMLKSALSPSLMDTMGKALTNVSIETFARSGTGLTRPDVFDWPSKIKDLTLKKNYSSILIFLGTNDTQGIQLNKKALAFGTAEWKKEYQERIKNINQLLCQSSKRAYWFEIPPMRENLYNSHIITLNNVIKDSMESCAQFVSTPKSLTTSDGAFASYVNLNSNSIKVREKDGIHLSIEGANLYAKYILNIIQQEKVN